MATQFFFIAFFCFLHAHAVASSTHHNENTPDDYGERCDSAQLQHIESANVMVNSNCPERRWMDFVIRHSIQSKGAAAFIVSVGCNKGDDFVSLVEAWSGNTTYNVDTWVHRLAERGVVSFACKKPAQHFPIIVDNVRPIRAYCIEPMPSNAALLLDVRLHLQFDPFSFQIKNIAVDTFPGTTQFPSGKVGEEDFGIGATKNMPTVPMNVTNLDHLIFREIRNEHLKNAHREHRKIDFLSIDTEGHDGRVVIGMSKALANKYVRVFEFEYNKIGPWKSMDLQLIVNLIDTMGYDCWWQGNHGELWRLTGCWLDLYYAKRTWSNVVCVDRQEKALHFAFVEHSRNIRQGTNSSVLPPQNHKAPQKSVPHREKGKNPVSKHRAHRHNSD